MIRRLLSKLLEKPGKKTGLALSLGYIFTVIFVCLLVVSHSISNSYLAVLMQDRADTLRSYASIAAVSLSGKPVQEEMSFDLPLSDKQVNVFTKAGNSFLNVFSSYSSDSPEDAETITLEIQGSGDEYRKSFDLQEIVVVRRQENAVEYVAAVAPIVNSDGTTAGLVEVLMPSSTFHATNRGLSLSWFFTVLSIAVTLTIVFYQIRKLADTLLGQPDPMLPKIIRYGSGGCQSIAFFSAAACVLPTAAIGKNMQKLMETAQIKDDQSLILFLLAAVLFALGFFALNNTKTYLSRLLTTRMILLVSVVLAILILAVSCFLDTLIVYLLILFPVGFCLGMVIFFQREYRVYASRLGYSEFSERKIHNTQFVGYLLGSCVGAVFSGILYERFGWSAVAILCSILLVLVLSESLIFVQHCPPTNEPRLYLPTFLYALSNHRSGTFLLSAVLPMGLNLAFFVVFVPQFLQTLSFSTVTVGFFYIVFFFACIGVVRLVLSLTSDRISTNGRFLLSAILQIIGFLVLALFPTAKILVVSTFILGFSMGLHEFRYLSFYKKMIQENKRHLARKIIEATFALGVVLGSILCVLIFFLSFSDDPTENIRIGLLIFTFFTTILLLLYPIILLLYSGNTTGQKRSRE